MAAIRIFSTSPSELKLRIALAALAVTTAAAAEVPRSEAERLFYDAKKLLDSEEYDEACTKLERSEELDPGLGTLALLAYCHEMQGRTATAYAEYGEAERMAQRLDDTERLQAIRQRRERLAPHLSTLRLAVDQPVAGLELMRAGKKLPASDWGRDIPVDPGTIVVAARAPGHQMWTANVTVGGDGAHVDVTIPPLARSASEESRPSRFDPPVLVALGVAAVGVGVGTYFGLRAASLNEDSNDHCDADSRCNQQGYDLRKDAQSSARAANIAFGIGAAGLATGLVLMFARNPSAEGKAQALIRIQPAARGGWATFERSF